MSPYRSIANAVGTREARDLAHRLAVWHDAMVIHRRRTGDFRSPSCDADCPHEEAELLWLESLQTYGERAHEFAFLRTYGIGSAQRDVSRAELRCDFGRSTRFSVTGSR